jgi:hypothetical protein
LEAPFWKLLDRGLLATDKSIMEVTMSGETGSTVNSEEATKFRPLIVEGTFRLPDGTEKRVLAMSSVIFDACAAADERKRTDKDKNSTSR